MAEQKHGGDDCILFARLASFRVVELFVKLKDRSFPVQIRRSLHFLFPRVVQYVGCRQRQDCMLHTVTLDGYWDDLMKITVIGRDNGGSSTNGDAVYYVSAELHMNVDYLTEFEQLLVHPSKL